MRIPVFLSYSSPYTEEQRAFIKEIEIHLQNRGLEPRTLGITDYDLDEPLTAIRRLMFESNGLLAIAFKRYYVVNGIEKPKSIDEKNISNKYFSSPWCHIEPAMAFQLGLPILIIREKGVIGTYLPEFDLSNPIEEYLKSEEWNQIIGEWEGYVRAVKKAKGKPLMLY